MTIWLEWKSEYSRMFRNHGLDSCHLTLPGSAAQGKPLPSLLAPSAWALVTSPRGPWRASRANQAWRSRRNGLGKKGPVLLLCLNLQTGHSTLGPAADSCPLSSRKQSALPRS